MAYKFWKCFGQSRELFSSEQDVIGAGLTNASALKMADVIHSTVFYITLSRPNGSGEKRCFFFGCRYGSLPSSTFATLHDHTAAKGRVPSYLGL